MGYCTATHILFSKPLARLTVVPWCTVEYGIAVNWGFPGGGSPLPVPGSRPPNRAQHFLA
eukprot:7370851-Prymnesium_polylepis.1